ncbi:hypothetical protein [Hespellia stercorisuis]|uniref:Uncharacterized protein n=1 Tax=Hespellia stercorisuis DSM 15480 TaxID=1121950 RepID=A0A1M6M6S0_9FIRM|nr:hypothetical protein [Hespellia stercorisuis]SHJ79114.1 hypothetical protein SAMN02745243_01378 [Hespellia stercorisuis DSM 15480]
MIRLQGECFGLLKPVVQIIQGAVSEEDVEQVYSVLQWTEDLSSMQSLLMQKRNCRKENKKLEKLLKEKLEENKQIEEYVQTICMK